MNPRQPEKAASETGKAASGSADNATAGHTSPVWLRLRSLFVPAALIGLVAIVYAQVLGYGFVNYDDWEYITTNPRMASGLTLDNITWAFQTGFHANWHPITWLSYLLDARLFRQAQGELNAGGFHATNLLFHAVNVVLLYVVLSKMTGLRWSSVLAAALFAVHPLHVESVAWISERKDVLSQFFGLLALLAYLRWVRAQRRTWYALALVAFLLSLMSKPTLVTFPFLLLLLDWWPLDRWDAPQWLRYTASAFGVKAAAIRGTEQPHDQGAPDHPDRSRQHSAARPPAKSRQKARDEPDVKKGHARTDPALKTGRASTRALILEKFPFFAGSVAMSVIAVRVQGDAVAAIEALPLTTRLANGAIAYGKYLHKAIWPTRLAVLYPYSEKTIGFANAGLAVVLLLTVTAVALQQRKTRPYLLLGWLWFLGTMVPMIGLVQIGKQQLADRYAYFPFVGLYIALAWLLADLSGKLRWGRYAATGVSLAAVAVLAVVARDQATAWRNSITLFERTLAVTTENPVAHINLGQALETAGRVPEAVAQYQKALAIDDRYAQAHINIGVAWVNLNQMKRAIEHFQKAVQLEPNNPRAQFQLGKALAYTGRHDQAVICYMRAIKLNPESALYHFELARALLAQRQFSPAVSHIERALLLDPDNRELMNFAFEAHRSLGATLANNGRPREGLTHLQRALQLHPQSAEVHNQLGLLLLKQGDRQNAAKHFREAVRLKPDFVEAQRNLDQTGTP